MRKHNPIFDPATVLASLTRAGRARIAFIPIALLELPFDPYRAPTKNTESD